MYPCDKGVQLTRALGRWAWGFLFFSLCHDSALGPRGSIGLMRCSIRFSCSSHTAITIVSNGQGRETMTPAWMCRLAPLKSRSRMA
jgi:hypothetical protein